MPPREEVRQVKYSIRHGKPSPRILARSKNLGIDVGFRE